LLIEDFAYTRSVVAVYPSGNGTVTAMKLLYINLLSTEMGDHSCLYHLGM